MLHSLKRLFRRPSKWGWTSFNDAYHAGYKQGFEDASDGAILTTLEKWVADNTLRVERQLKGLRHSDWEER